MRSKRKRRGISQTLAIALAVIVLAGAAAAAVVMKGGSNTENNTASQTETKESRTTNPETTTSQSHQGETYSLEGTWSGTYNGNYGSGEWTWVIKKDPTGKYIGCLETTGTYKSSWIPIQITIEDNKITLGTVMGGVIFTGTISKDTASGTWKLTNGGDNGSWQGKKISGETNLPCMPNNSATTTTTSQSTSASTTESSGTQEIYLPIGDPLVIAKNISKTIMSYLGVLSVAQQISPAVNNGGMAGIGYGWPASYYSVGDNEKTRELVTFINNYLEPYGYKLDNENSQYPGHWISTNMLFLLYENDTYTISIQIGYQTQDLAAMGIEVSSNS